MNACPINGSLEVVQEGAIQGAYWVYVNCADYFEYKSLPAGIQYRGMTLGKAGWNSDSGMCAYSTSKLFAIAK